MAHKRKRASRARLRRVTRVLESVKTIFTWLVVAAAIAMMIFTVISVNTFDRNDRSIFGYKAFVVRSDSMKATDFEAGDLVLVKQVEPTTLAVGDIIAFHSVAAESLGETLTHKIRAMTTTADGEPAFITYGTTTNVEDVYPVTYGQIQGKYQFAVRNIGSLFIFLKTVPGYICCILIPFLFLILVQGVNCIRIYRRYREEQLAENEARFRKQREVLARERERLAKERAETQRLLLQLRQMKNEMDSAAAGESAKDI